MKTALFLVLFTVASAADAAGTLSPELPYQASRTNAVTYDVDFSRS